jgi:cysteine desulfurase
MSLELPIFMDNHSTTRVDPVVLETMLPFFSETYGNAASKNHTYGQEAEAAVTSARATLAQSIKAKPQEIIFTSGATEALNLAIKGVAEANQSKGKHFITLTTEHKAVMDSFSWLEKHGYETTQIGVGEDGVIDLDALEAAIRPDTVLVAVMAANNEIGVLQPLEAIGQLCRQNEVFFLTDATQALGKVPLDVEKMQIDLLACSAHKIYGPKGVGALYVRRSLPRVPVSAIIDGGGHEAGLRSGTLNVPAIVGLGKAVELSLSNMAKEEKRLGDLRDKLEERLLTEIPDSHINGSKEHRLAGNLNIRLPKVNSEALMIALREDLAISSGSACTTAAVEPSHVLKALGLSDEAVYSSVRFGLGRFNTEEEVEYAADRTIEEYQRLAEFALV